MSRTANAAATTTRAVVRTSYGPVGTLRLAPVPKPVAGKGQVLLRVHAAGLDRGAWHLMTGRPYLMRLAFGVRRPRNPVLGREVAGTVVEVGPGVTRFAVGDEVFGICPGAFAEYAVADPAKLARKPADLTFEQAAVLPISGLTALQALRDAGRVEAGQRVLVIGASGGVGTYAVQLARASGALVTGVCSTAKLDLVRSLGAERVVDYTREDYADGEHRYDLVLDIAGNPSVSRLQRTLTPTGTAVLVGGEQGGNLTGGMDRQLRALATSLVVRQRLTGLLCKENAADLERLTQYVESGQLTPVVDRSCPLEQVPDAMRDLEAGRVSGKIAIRI